MASFGTYVTNFVKTAFYTILPNKVDEYSYEHYVSEYFTLEKVEILYSCFIFYKVANHYDMIYVPPAASLDTLSKDRRVYSLFRFQGDVKVGLEFFKHYADVIAILADINSKHETKLDRVWLEKITGLCRRYSTWTAAHVAASLNFLPAFQDQRVISLINKIDSETGWTPLFVAVKAGSVEAVKAIMAVKDFRQGIVDSEANSVLHVASSLASAEILEILLDIAPKVDGALPSNGTQRLPTGNRNNERATVNAVNTNGETALHIACSTPSPQCVEALLKAGANPLIGTADLYPIHIAIEKESTECVNLLCEYCPGGINLQTRKMKLSVLHLAKQKPQLFDHLCDLGVELNLRNSSGQTILHEAVREQNLDRVLALLMLGASTVIGDSVGAHPLHYAVEPKNPDVHIIYALLAFEADPNAEDSNGHTARHWLCRHESGKYQHSITRDTALYALDAVRARRCPIDREQCTAGCIAVESIASGQRRPTPSMQQSMSLSFLFQMMQEKMGSGCSSDPDTATETPNEATLLENELIFNGTPPAPVLNASLLKDDLDNDLFSCIITKKPHNSRHKKNLLSRSIFTRHRSGQSGASTARTGRLFTPAVPPSELGDPGTEADDSDLPGPPSIAVTEASKSTNRHCLSDVNPPWPASQEQQLRLPAEDEGSSTPVANGNSLCPSRSMTSLETLQTTAENGPRSAETAEQDEEEGEEEEEKSTPFWFNPSVLSSFLSVAIPFTADIFTSTPAKDADLSQGKGSGDGGGDGGLGETTSPAADSNDVSSIAEVSKPTPIPDPPIFYFPPDSSSTLNVPTDPSNPERQDSECIWSRQFPECYAPPNVPCCRQRNSRRIAVDRTGDAMTSSVVHKPSPEVGGAEDARGTGASSPQQRGRLAKHTDAEGFRCCKRGYRVLSLDGGGIRGLILCQALRALERAAGRPIRELYDWIIGTSTGAMLALNIAQGKCIRHNRCLYLRMKDRVFSGKRPYPTDALENMLASEFGSQSLLTDITDIRISVTALRGDHFPPKLYIFRNYPAPYERMEQLVTELLAERSRKTSASSSSASPDQHPSSPLSPATANRLNNALDSPPPTNQIANSVPLTSLLGTVVHKLFGETIKEVGDSEDPSSLEEEIVALLTSFSRRYVFETSLQSKDQQLIWRAARASGAAPSYFRPCGPYLDGGLISNNPTLDILTEIQEMNLVRRLRRESIVPVASITSLGTGRLPVRDVHQIDVFRPQNMMEAYRAAVGVSELSRILVEMATMSEGRVVERSRAWCSSLGVPFFRFSPLLSSEVALNVTDNRIILQMLWETEAYLCSCRDRIRRLADQLLLAE